ncbi:hypothetical protein F5X98DRAFT_375581 [Xylaria grammica]|nr:hypothetical protein F5X98DRAFT_375581 [Xylaria grammica]
MDYNNYYNHCQSTVAGGAEANYPGDDGEKPAWAMQPQIHRSGVVPSDEVLVKSLYKQLLKDEWELRYKPAHDYPDEYDLPPSLLGHSLWLQRKSPFFRAHGQMREKDVYIAKKKTFLNWIEKRFMPETAGVCGATQDLCFIVGGYVFWVDLAAASAVGTCTKASGT